jgi:hypothetical protein
MNTAFAQGMRELSAAEVLMVSGGDGGESGTWEAFERSRDESYQASYQEASWVGPFLRTVITIMAPTPLNVGEDDYLRGLRDGQKSSDIGGNNAGVSMGSYDSRDSMGMGGDPGFW